MPDSPFKGGWHQTKEAGASSPEAAGTQRPGPVQTGQPQAAAFRGKAGGAAAAQWGPPWPGPPELRSDGTAGPARSFPSPGKARTGRGWPLGCLWPAAGAVLAGLGAAGAADHGRLVATASARMRRGWSSLKCGSLLSLTPASLPRRAVARKLFLCLTRSHALPSPSFSCSALRPPWQGAPTVVASRVFLSPLARFLAAMILVIWLAWTPPKPSLDGLAKGWGLIGWWPRGLRKRIWIEMGLSQDLRKAEM